MMKNNTTPGFTLIEIMVSTVIGLVVALGVGLVIHYLFQQSIRVQNQTLTNMTLHEVNNVALNPRALRTSASKAENVFLFQCLDATDPALDCTSRSRHEFTLYTPDTARSGTTPIPATAIAGIDPDNHSQYIRYSRTGTLCKSTQPHDQCPIIAKTYFTPICMHRSRTQSGPNWVCKNTQDIIVKTEFAFNTDPSISQVMRLAVAPEIRNMLSMGISMEVTFMDGTSVGGGGGGGGDDDFEDTPGSTRCISLNQDNQCSGLRSGTNIEGGFPAISYGGRYIVFCAESKLVFNKTDPASSVVRVFLHDRAYKTTTLVSAENLKTTPIPPPNDRHSCFYIGPGEEDPDPWLDGYAMNRPSISASATDPNIDGRFVAFTSFSKLNGADTNNHADIYVRDTRPDPPTASPTTELISVVPAAQAYATEISPDARFVAYLSIEMLDPTILSSIRLRNRATGRTTIVSLKSNGDRVQKVHARPAISADGRFVTFSAFGTDVVENAGLNDWTGCALYVRDTTGGLSIYKDDGATFLENKTTASGLGSLDIRSIWALDTMIYAATNNGLSISNDKGASFFKNIITMASTPNAGSSDVKIANFGSNNVRSVYVSDDGTRIYAATAPVNGEGGGLSISSDGGTSFFTNITTSTTNFGSNDVRGVFVSANGSNIYAATAPVNGVGGGLSISTNSGTNFTNITTPQIASMDVRGVFVTTAPARIFVATAGGLTILDDNGSTFPLFRTITDTPDVAPWNFQLPTNNVRSVFAQGTNVFVATSGGLIILKNNGEGLLHTITTTPDPLPPWNYQLASNDVRSVFALGSRVFVATAGGLNILDNNVTSFGLNRTITNSILPANNNVWSVAVLGTNIYAAQMGITTLVNWNKDNTGASRVLLNNGTQCTDSYCQGYAASPSISADGRYVSFDTNTNDLTAAPGCYTGQSFVRDMTARTTQRVSTIGGPISPGLCANMSDGYQTSLSAGKDNTTGKEWLRVTVNSNKLSKYFTQMAPSEPRNIFYRQFLPIPAVTLPITINTASQAARDPNYPETNYQAFIPSNTHGIISGDGNHVVFDSMAGNFDCTGSVVFNPATGNYECSGMNRDINKKTDVFIRTLPQSITAP